MRCTASNNCMQCEPGKEKHNGICLDIDNLITGQPGRIESNQFNLSEALIFAHK